MDTMTTALKKAIYQDSRTPAAIARASGIDKGILSRFLRDERDMTLSTADRVCGALGVDVRLVRRGKQKGG
jgi:transcriptional regulator with XRE-family HTH domain